MRLLSPMMKMNKYKVLILTDHKEHTQENSLYDLASKLLMHDKTFSVDVSSRAVTKNDGFFNKKLDSLIFATSVNSDFAFSKKEHPLNGGLRAIEESQYDLVWLRLPPPLDKQFLDYLSLRFQNRFIINSPRGIHLTGTKEFLLNFQSVCPPLKICRHINDIIEFKEKFPIVLKPFRAYGGAGIVRIENETVWIGNRKVSFSEFQNQYDNTEYLGVKFLKNVDKGDKRIIVVNGKILGASLRLPARDSWICNVAMGGSSHKAVITNEEYEIIEAINPRLIEMGIVMYGVDTLVGDDGKRVLSELNTTSIGGLPQIAKMNKEPLVEKAIDLIWDYYEEQLS